MRVRASVASANSGVVVCGWILAIGLVVACGGSSNGSSPPPDCVGDDCGCDGPGTIMCGDTCTNIQSNPTSCGACAHDCLGEGCHAGLCQPELLASVIDSASSMALDGDDLVIATSGLAGSTGGVYRISKTTGAVTTMYRGLGAEPSLAVHDGTLYVADSALSTSCSADGAGSILAITPTDIHPVSLGRSCATSLIADADRVVWAENADVTTFPSSQPYAASAPIAGDPFADPTRITAGVSDMQSLTEVGDSLYWVDLLNLETAPSASGTTSIVQTDVSDFGINGDTLVYLPTVVGGSVIVKSLSSGQTTASVDTYRPPLLPTKVLVDDSFAYWVDQGVWALDLHSLRIQMIVSFGNAIAMDDTYLYVASSSVLRVRKPAALIPLPSVLTCDAPMQQCGDGDACTDTRSDRFDCGSCGHACAASESCVASACTCAEPNLVCDGVCTDVVSDPANCGACGHSCGDGARCTSGACQPRTVDPSISFAFVLDDSALYYQTAAAVKRRDKATGVITTLDSFPAFEGLATDGTTLFATQSDGTIVSLPKTPHAHTTLYPTRPNPRHLAATTTAIAWIEDPNTVDTTPITLTYGAKDSSSLRGSITPVGLYAGSDTASSRGLIASGSSVYWLLADAGTNHGAIVKVDLSTTPATRTVIAQLDRSPRSFAVASDHFVVIAGSDNAADLLSIPLTGGAATLLLPALYETQALVLDTDSSPTWIEGTFNIVVRQLSPITHAPRALVRTNASELAIDAANLYLGIQTLDIVSR